MFFRYFYALIRFGYNRYYYDNMKVYAALIMNIIMLVLFFLLFFVAYTFSYFLSLPHFLCSLLRPNFDAHVTVSSYKKLSLAWTTEIKIIEIKDGTVNKRNFKNGQRKKENSKQES